MLNQNPKNKNKKPLIAGMGYNPDQGQVGYVYDKATDILAGASQLLPLPTRTYLRGILPSVKDEVLGSQKIPTSEKPPIGGEHFRRGEIEELNQTISNSMKRLGKDGDEKYLKNPNVGQVTYADYPKGKRNLKISLGNFSWERLPNGDIRVFDTYDFQNQSRKFKVAAIDQQKKEEGLVPTILTQLKNSATEAPYHNIQGGPHQVVRSFMGNLGMIFAGDENTAKGVDFIYRPSTYETFHTPVNPETGKRPKYGSLRERLADMNPPEAYVEIVHNMIKTNDVKNSVKTQSVQKKAETRNEE